MEANFYNKFKNNLLNLTYNVIFLFIMLFRVHILQKIPAFIYILLHKKAEPTYKRNVYETMVNLLANYEHLKHRVSVSSPSLQIVLVRTVID